MLTLDWESRTAQVAGSDVRLTPRQFEVLAYFATRADAVVPRDRVLADVWGYDFDPGTNVVSVHVHHIRRRLVEHSIVGAFQTIRGRGYRFRMASVASASPRRGES